MNKEIAELITIRPYRDEDKAFIMATFLRGLYYGDSWFSAVHKAAFMDNYKLVIEALLSNGRNTVHVACLKEDPNVILGYSLLSNDFQTIHWCFIKSNWRKQGIAKALLPQHPTVVTHLTAIGKTLLPKFKDCIFNPFKL